MGVFDFLKSKDSLDREKQQSDYSDIFRRMIHALQTTFGDHREVIHSLDSYREFSSLTNEEKRTFIQCSLDFIQGLAGRSGPSANQLQHGLNVLSVILGETDLNDDDIVKTSKVIGLCRKEADYYARVVVVPLLAMIEKRIRDKGMNSNFESALKNLVVIKEYMYNEEQKLNEYIDFLLQGNPDRQYNLHDLWGKAVDSYFATTSPLETTSWTKLFEACRKAGTKGEPSNKWLKEAKGLLEDIGQDIFSIKMIEWLSLVKARLQDIHKDKGNRYDFLRDENHNILKGLIWCTGIVNNRELNNALDDYAQWAFKKKPNIGPISGKTGTACMFAFSLLPMQDGVPRLSKFKTKIKNNTLLKSINRFIKDVAENNGVSQDEVQEITVPDYGVIDGRLVRVLGDVKAIYDLNDQTQLWEKEGKARKSVPTEIKENFGAELKAFKSTIKELEETLPIVKDRIEKSYINQRQWNFATWRTRFIDHPLTAQLAKKLIWHFFEDDKKDQGIWLNEKLVNATGQPLDWVNENTRVQLWHPIGFTSEEVLNWRNFIEENKITQPFKQAYREVYIITDAELNTEVYSNRFAAHVLRQHQFAALCKQRGWQYHLMGAWDSHNTPTLQLPQWKLYAQYYIDADHNSVTNDAGIFNFIVTDQVRFFNADHQPIPVHEVPAMVFTEVMRDVDLFVGVTSIGNDPNWQDGGNAFMNGYWQSYSFGDLSESAQIREQVLQNLIPKMKIASQCSFDKKFLIVRGKVRTYKIHMGSGNILMEPNDQYLCIVAGRSSPSPDRVFLPFEGDNLLSIIISKALLLADDDKITDKTILSQIGRK